MPLLEQKDLRDLGENYEYIPKNYLYVVSEHDNFVLDYAKPGDVGIDIPVIIKGSRLDPPLNHFINEKEGWLEIPTHGTAEIPTGLRIKIPEDAWGNIRPRSSTIWKKRLIVIPSTIDSGFTGPLYVLARNMNYKPVRIHDGDRLAQLILVPKYPLIGVNRVTELPKTSRADACFGSSGGIKEVYS